MGRQHIYKLGTVGKRIMSTQKAFAAKYGQNIMGEEREKDRGGKLSMSGIEKTDWNRRTHFEQQKAGSSN